MDQERAMGPFYDDFRIEEQVLRVRLYREYNCGVRRMHQGLSRLLHELEFHLHRSADGAIIRGFILAHVSTDLADAVSGPAG
ncbi:MAG: hypothetical protein JRI71_09895 [Deltaproteobacteria bacterium]|nr:hypothetical protein [Deltaproteobacteria bacterium]